MAARFPSACCWKQAMPPWPTKSPWSVLPGSTWRPKPRGWMPPPNWLWKPKPFTSFKPTRSQRMDNLFQTRSLTAAVNLINPVPTIVLDQVFGRKLRQLSPRFAWDVQSVSDRVLKSISAAEPAQVAAMDGYNTITCDAPRFAEKRLITASDLSAMQGFGQAALPELLKERIGREQAQMRRKMDLTREFMAAKALTGQIIDDTGT